MGFVHDQGGIIPQKLPLQKRASSAVLSPEQQRQNIW
jgi:hypothetical protein